MIGYLKRFSFLAVVWTTAAAGADRPAGDFDYYVLALSWNAAWCAAEGDDRGADQCDPRHDLGFVVHGLWPQYEAGWPEYCRTTARDPSRRQTAAMADIMGDGGAAWYQWKKHGRCSGLDPEDYFAAVRHAYDMVRQPSVLRQVDRPLRIRANVIEDAFLQANSSLAPDGITVTCKGGLIREARICLTRDLDFRDCAPDTRRDCRLTGQVFLQMK